MAESQSLDTREAACMEVEKNLSRQVPDLTVRDKMTITGHTWPRPPGSASVLVRSSGVGE